MISERLISDFYGFSFLKNHFVNEEFNRRTVQLFESGIIDGLLKYYISLYHAVGWKAEDEGPQVLEYDHLESWFQLWFGCLIVSLLSFLCEHFKKIFTGRLTFGRTLSFKFDMKKYHQNVQKKVDKKLNELRQMLRKRNFLRFKRSNAKLKSIKSNELQDL
jgi:hypothetical protein